MPPPNSQPNPPPLQPGEQAVIQTRKRLDRSLEQLSRAIVKFKAAEGERQSVEVLEQALIAAVRSRPDEFGPPSASVIADRLNWQDELKSSALAREIFDDLEAEAQESETEHAAKLLACLRDLEAKIEAYRDAQSGFAAKLQKEVVVMPDGECTPNKSIRVRVTADTSSGGAAASKVQSQLIATLDSFGLPHRDGILATKGPEAARLADRLFDTLGRRFDVNDDPMSGLRASPRRFSLYQQGSSSSQDLTGRLEIAAGAAIATIRQIGLTTDDLISLADSIEDWPITEPARIDAARARIERQLESLRGLAGRAGGPPKDRCSYELGLLKQAISQQLTALGLRRHATIDPEADWEKLEKAFKTSCRDQLPNLALTVRDEIVGLIDQLFDQAKKLDHQLTSTHSNLSRSEASYHLRRILEAIATQVEATRADIDESPASATWIGAGIGDPATRPKRYLSEQLEEALGWLEELAATYGLSDRAYDEMRPAAVAELSSALTKLQATIGDCAGALAALNIPDDDDVFERLNGLKTLIGSAVSLANDLAYSTED